jgi:hypothetical protein
MDMDKPLDMLEFTIQPLTIAAGLADATALDLAACRHGLVIFGRRQWIARLWINIDQAAAPLWLWLHIAVDLAQRLIAPAFMQRQIIAHHRRFGMQQVIRLDATRQHQGSQRHQDQGQGFTDINHACEAKADWVKLCLIAGFWFGLRFRLFISGNGINLTQPAV